jgi:endonuclease YncB( thermonuclease family)
VLTLIALILGAIHFLNRMAPQPREEGRFAAVDGDSLRRDGQDFRLKGIDAPELHQSCEDDKGKAYPCGLKARDALQQLVKGRSIACEVVARDRYERMVSICFDGDRDINAAMVRAGWATAYLRHGSEYQQEEAEARLNGRGIWQGRFEEPEAWRDEHRRDLRRGLLSADEPTDD